MLRQGHAEVGNQLGHCAADVDIEVVPDDHERAAELGGVQQPGVVRFGEALAAVAAGAAAAANAVDQPRPLSRLDRDQRGQRYPPVML